jgi:hypothetical protein
MPTKSAADGIAVEGLDELRKALKAMDGALAKELGQINKTFSTEIAAEAKGKALSIGGVARHTAAGIKASASAQGVFVKLDARTSPGILGAEFGGGAHGAGNPTATGGYTTQFGAHRGRQGGALYSAVRALSTGAAIDKRYGAAIEQLASRAFR